MSTISLIGVITFSIDIEKIRKVLFLLVSFAAGALLGDAFIHLLPEIVEENGFTLSISIYLLSGIAVMFLIEKVVRWRHCHLPMDKQHVHSYAVMNLLGDTAHNVIDGLIIGASYLVSIPVGIATTIAVILHEIPQEISDFGVLIHGGYSRNRALFFNFITALAAVVGTIFALILSSSTEYLTIFLVPFSAGSFIYIATADLIPELHKEVAIRKSFPQFIAFLLGVGIMVLMLGLG